MIGEEAGDTFVSFCPPWSSSCQRLVKTWTDLASSLAREDEEVRGGDVSWA